MNVNYQFAEGDIRDFVPEDTESELACELMIRTMHAFRYYANMLSNVDGHVCEQATSAIITILTPAEGARLAAQRGYEDDAVLEPFEWALSLDHGDWDVEYFWMNGESVETWS